MEILAEVDGVELELEIEEPENLLNLMSQRLKCGEIVFIETEGVTHYVLNDLKIEVPVISLAITYRQDGVLFDTSDTLEDDLLEYVCTAIRKTLFTQTKDIVVLHMCYGDDHVLDED